MCSVEELKYGLARKVYCSTSSVFNIESFSYFLSSINTTRHEGSYCLRFTCSHFMSCVEKVRRKIIWIVWNRDWNLAVSFSYHARDLTRILNGNTGYRYEVLRTPEYRYNNNSHRIERQMAMIDDDCILLLPVRGATILIGNRFEVLVRRKGFEGSYEARCLIYVYFF